MAKKLETLASYLDAHDVLLKTAQYFGFTQTLHLIMLMADVYTEKTDKIDLSLPFWDDFSDYLDRETITTLIALVLENPELNDLGTLRQFVVNLHQKEERYAYAAAAAMDTKVAKKRQQDVEVTPAEVISPSQVEPEKEPPNGKTAHKRSTSIIKISYYNELQSYELAKAELYRYIAQTCSTHYPDLYNQIGQIFFENHEEEFAAWFYHTRIVNPNLPQTPVPPWTEKVIKRIFKEAKGKASTLVLRPVVV